MHKWQQQLKDVKTVQTDAEALDALEDQCGQAVQSLRAQQVIAGQAALEEVLAWSLIALDRIQVNADQALQRVLARWQAHEGKKRFVVYPDFVEIWVGNEYRGGWPLQSGEDHKHVGRLANELGCTVEYSNTRQLSLLS